MDRSASYAARWVAKNLVAAGLAGRCLVQVAYAIGVAHPVSVMVETFGTARTDPATLGAGAGAFRPEAWGHHPGPEAAESHLCADRRLRSLRRSEPGFTWEETSLADDLRRAAG